MNAVLLRYLPVPDPERVVYLRVEGRPSGTWETGDDSLTFNEPAFEHMRGERRVLSDLVAFVPLGFCLSSKSDSFAKSALCRNPASGRLSHVNWAHDPAPPAFSFLVGCLLPLAA